VFEEREIAIRQGHRHSKGGLVNRKTPEGLRITFLAHFVIGGLVGIQHLLAPRLWTDLGGMDIAETVTWRLIGAALLAFAAGSRMATENGYGHASGLSS
jgi:hypothetical protein